MFKLREAFAVSGAGCKGGSGGSRSSRESRLAGYNRARPASSRLAGYNRARPASSSSRFPTSRRRVSRLAENV